MDETKRKCFYAPDFQGSSNRILERKTQSWAPKPATYCNACKSRYGLQDNDENPFYSALKMRVWWFSGQRPWRQFSSGSWCLSVVDMKKKVWGIRARRGCDVNLMIPGLPSRILWCSECYPSYPGGGLCFQHLLTLICSDILFLSKSYSPGKSDVFHSRRARAAGLCAPYFVYLKIQWFE